MDTGIVNDGLSRIWTAENIAIVVQMVIIGLMAVYIWWRETHRNNQDAARIEADKDQTKALTELTILVKVLLKL